METREEIINLRDLKPKDIVLDKDKEFCTITSVSPNYDYADVEYLGGRKEDEKAWFYRTTPELIIEEIRKRETDLEKVKLLLNYEQAKARFMNPGQMEFDFNLDY